MITMNEVKFVEETLLSGNIDKKPTLTISLLAKYFKQKKNISDQDTIKMILDFMAKNYPYFNKVKWINIIENIVSKADVYKIREVQYIEVPVCEIEEIKKLNSIRKERVLFTMLCMSKFYNTINKDNNNWVNTSIPDIFSSARVNMHTSDEKYY